MISLYVSSVVCLCHEVNLTARSTDKNESLTFSASIKKESSGIKKLEGGISGRTAAQSATKSLWEISVTGDCGVFFFNLNIEYIFFKWFFSLKLYIDSIALEYPTNFIDTYIFVCENRHT